jgi:hypothetical protein
VLDLADSIADAETLNSELVRRHLDGWDLDFGSGFEQLLRKRGRDVFPYILPRAGALARGWRTRSSVKDLVVLAEERGWLDLWSTLIRTAVDQSTFERAVIKLVENRTLPESEIRRRLVMLTGASNEWNFGPFSFARVVMLGDEAAVKLYERFPDLVRGPFKMNVGMSWSSDNAVLTERAIALGDELLIDYLASRVAMTVPLKVARATDLLADHYLALLARPHEFAIRAASALTQIPAFAVWNYDGLLKSNPLARILFERTEELFLHDPRSVRDLLESPQIHVQALAFRILGGSDSRARELAATNVDLLQATLFRPLHRRTRLMAFRAIDNAASTAGTAGVLVERIREAFYLPETRYPREELIGLLASILKRWPELRGEHEQPVIYGVAS